MYREIALALPPPPVHEEFGAFGALGAQSIVIQRHAHRHVSPPLLYTGNWVHSMRHPRSISILCTENRTNLYQAKYTKTGNEIYKKYGCTLMLTCHTETKSMTEYFQTGIKISKEETGNRTYLFEAEYIKTANNISKI